MPPRQQTSIVADFDTGRYFSKLMLLVECHKSTNIFFYLAYLCGCCSKRFLMWLHWSTKNNFFSKREQEHSFRGKNRPLIPNLKLVFF